MQNYALTHLSDAVLLRDLAALVTQDRVTIAMVLAHIAEVDARRLYVPAGNPSMHAYCVDELRLSEDAAYKRIRAARAGREFPALFDALAEGRLHLAAVSLLAPHLTRENAEELIEAATHRRKSEIEELLARRFALQAAPMIPRSVTAMTCELSQLATGRVGPEAAASVGMFNEHAPGHVDNPRENVPPPSPERFDLHLTIEKSTRDRLRYAQALLSHAVPTGDVAQVLHRALGTLIVHLEKRKFGATRRPRRLRSPSGNGPTRSRYVPAHVRRAVWERDQGQCTFMSAKGIRCKATRFLEFDHVDPVARGGEARVGTMRLRCRAHNQYEAERAFGAGFMNQGGTRHASRAVPLTRSAALRPGTRRVPGLLQRSRQPESRSRMCLPAYATSVAESMRHVVRPRSPELFWTLRWRSACEPP
jgi:hypothetical protein